ncbi:hypothetical protein DBZ36_06960 [Alginatibacterium sediminis]|uniref:Uncharacterized protein n=1 Tax=Alginatibacterium sediminis TaxID=2164068 RepID=A0A420EHP3_9ALTE|nr:hypothetical protein DBZ36_06960 [Alginatibacterium sediminis]
MDRSSCRGSLNVADETDKVLLSSLRGASEMKKQTLDQELEVIWLTIITVVNKVNTSRQFEHILSAQSHNPI